MHIRCIVLAYAEHMPTQYIFYLYFKEILLHYILFSGRRNRTLHLYEVTATNLLVLGVSRANAETCVRLRSVGAAVWWWCEKIFLLGG